MSKILDINGKPIENKKPELPKIDINESFKGFLKVTGNSTLKTEDHRNRKMAFMAGANEILSLIRTQIPLVSEKEGIELLNKAVDQVNEYWKKLSEK